MSELSVKLRTTLDNLGSTERTKGPSSQDKLDDAAHEFNVAQFIRTYGDKRYKKAKENLVKALGDVVRDKLVSIKAWVKKKNLIQTIELAESGNYRIAALVNIGAPYVDIEGFKQALLVKIHNGENLTAVDVNLAFKAASKSYDPTVTYILTEVN